MKVPRVAAQVQYGVRMSPALPNRGGRPTVNPYYALVAELAATMPEADGKRVGRSTDAGHVVWAAEDTMRHDRWLWEAGRRSGVTIRTERTPLDPGRVSVKLWTVERTRHPGAGGRPSSTS